MLPGAPLTASETFEAIQNEPPTPLDALTRQELNFLMEYVRSGDAFTAARRVGYSMQMSFTAVTLLDRPLIRKALRAIRATQRETLRQRQINSASTALTYVADIMDDRDVDPRVRLQAAMKLMDMSGSVAPKEMSDELRDDAPMERVSVDKIALAFKEAADADKL